MEKKERKSKKKDLSILVLESANGNDNELNNNDYNEDIKKDISHYIRRQKGLEKEGIEIKIKKKRLINISIGECQ